jgi:membrane-bound serine protease (ClpP class)
MRVLIFVALVVLFFQKAAANCTLSIELRDAIGPATLDYMQQAQEAAKEKGCVSILARINTPGGSLQSTRLIVEQIMNSEIPYLCLIHPSGGHAGSAGAIIMQACHVNGASEATNIGAASPIASTGQELPEDLKKKIFEDSRSWVEGLAEYRERSKEFANDIILEAKALPAKEAQKAGAIDVVVTDIQSFLDFAKEQKVRLNSEEKTQVEVGPIELYAPGLRHDIFQIFSNPQWAYLLFMGSIALLYFEMTNPGVILPGVVGAIGLVISLMNFHMLDVSWGGVVLMLLGVAFMFSELFVPSFGALGLGGLASFVIGSLFLFDEKSGYSLPAELLIGTSLVMGLLMGGVTYLAVSGERYGLAKREKEKMTGKKLLIKKFDSETKQGMAQFKGEWWKVVSNDDLRPEEQAEIVRVEGLTLTVKKLSKG